MMVVQTDVTKPEEVAAALKKVNTLLEYNSSLSKDSINNLYQLQQQPTL